MITENPDLARLIAEVVRLSAVDVDSDERWAGVDELRQLDAEQIYEIAAGLCTDSRLIERELGADLLGSYKILKATPTTLRLQEIEILLGLLTDESLAYWPQLCMLWVTSTHPTASPTLRG
jgi:hypothetical protein